MSRKYFKIFAGIIKNAFFGCAGILGFNFLLSSTGIAVGINALTVLVVGILGLPGFMLLYAARLMILP
ncbi:MAG: pro-sigmaK processing inhibitor BofA family protein [Clostridiales bacterium]|jgi:hypothetical protein|nr:pro-sigmaK processing inhibitor BofA family protein [Clostridiales bacterium]